jgi:enoyl-[acyl-carrier-protein] reductase (NADH)
VFTDYTEEDYNLVMNTNVGASADQPSSAERALLAVLSKSTMPASKALAMEYAANNIRFNTVSPGVVNTPMHANGDHAELAKFHPLGRIGEVSDVVDAVLYLQNATFVTGENIRVDGGIHAGR